MKRKIFNNNYKKNKRFLISNKEEEDNELQISLLDYELTNLIRSNLKLKYDNPSYKIFQYLNYDNCLYCNDFKRLYIKIIDIRNENYKLFNNYIIYICNECINNFEMFLKNVFNKINQYKINVNKVNHNRINYNIEIIFYDYDSYENINNEKIFNNNKKIINNINNNIEIKNRKEFNNFILDIKNENNKKYLFLKKGYNILIETLTIEEFLDEILY